ncbi:dynein axonemal heavy chain 6-like [Montipora capricornis]|uniref:dynein axonemal heavy chain 6-like n=1 Tax=Montipora capricornis TaxID=246305 RepID=UPI0035F165C6
MLLGQGHWPVAEKMITNATKTGDRIFLQEVQEDFALFLNCMLTKTFPVTVLQNSVKVANKPSKGSKQILKELLVNSVLIHLRVIERKKFGQLDWNVRYKFRDWGRESALDNLKMSFTEGRFLGMPSPISLARSHVDDGLRMLGTSGA